MCGHVAQRLDIVDDRRLAEEADHLRETAASTLGIGALAFQRIEQPGFLAAHVTPGAQVQVQLKTVIGAENVLAEIMRVVRFRDRLGQSSAASRYSPRRKM